ncbi:Transposase and inactivated derivatives [hydrothermal vent metagenome]|uniref:Transposase and inactivated derivatives n=1 Tax=hydrothermal vent metagenome TaxID=652676 RepID=A0A3B0T011_9ZZZZ
MPRGFFYYLEACLVNYYYFVTSMSQNSKYIHKSHNVTVLLYHFVSSAKYRRVVITDSVDKVLVEVCDDIENRYEVSFLEIGTDENHVHFLISLGLIPRGLPRFLEESLKTDGFHQIKNYLPLNASWACPEDFFTSKGTFLQHY